MKDKSGNPGLSYRWVIWGIMVLSYMVVFFHRLAAGVVRPDLQSAFGLSASSFGFLASMYFYAYMLMQIPVGIMADSLGARKTVTAGMLLAGLGSLVFGAAHSQGMLLLGRFMVGIGVSTVFVCILKIQSRWFREREFATMSGCTNFIGNLGGVMAQTPLAMAVAAFTWRTTFAGIGFFSLAVAAACYLMIRNSPSVMGWPPINETQKQGSVEHVSGRELMEGLVTVLKCWRTWPNFVFLGCMSGIYLGFSGAWGGSFLREVYGMDGAGASVYVAWVVYGVMAGGFFTGWVSDKMGRRKPPLFGMTLLSTLAWAFLVFWGGGKPPLAALKPLLFVIGFSATAYVLSWALAKETQSPRATGVAISVINMGAFLGTAIITTGMGFIIEALQASPALAQYRAAFAFCLGCSSLALLCTFLMPETHCRNIAIEKE